MRLPYAVLFTGATMLLAGAAAATERGSAARSIGPQDFQAQDGGLPGAPSLVVPESTYVKPYLMTFAFALARSLGVNLEIRNGRADLFTFLTTQSDTLALTAGGGSSGTFLNLRWQLGH